MTEFLLSLFSIGWVQLSAAVFAALSFILYLLNRLKKVKGKNEDLVEYQSTRRAMDKVGRMSDADAAREWLSDRGKRKGDM